MHLLVRLASFSVAALLVACSELGNGTGQVSQRIGDLARQPGTRQIDLAQLTSFGWDRFFVFKPGTTRAEIC